MTRARLHLHLPGRLGRPDGAKLPPLYRQFADWLQARGGEVRIFPRDLAELEGIDDPDVFHLIHNGRIEHPRVLNSGLGYLDGFWYADPKGIFGDSSLASTRFLGRSIPARAAHRFFERLQRQFVMPRRSRYGQPRQTTDLPDGAIALFLQGRSEPVKRARHMTAQQMVATVVSHPTGRPVIVKPHPRNLDAESTRILVWLAEQHPEVILSDANVHDILAQAAVTVSISSAVSLEGMLHRKPAVLFGRADFHHTAETVTKVEEWPAALDRALTRRYPVERYLYWFLQMGMIDLGHPNWPNDLLRRIAAQGFDPERFGLATGEGEP